jgi:hypothetical protein
MPGDHLLKKGDPRPPGAGRKKGQKNYSTLEIKQLAQSFGREAIETLVTLMKTSTDERTRVAAARDLLDRGYGKAAQPMVGEDGQAPVEIRHVISWMKEDKPAPELPERFLGSTEPAPLH